MVFPFKHPLGWLLLLAALGLVGCNDEATTPNENTPEVTYEQPLVPCGQGRLPENSDDEQDSIPTTLPSQEVMIGFLNESKTAPMTREELAAQGVTEMYTELYHHYDTGTPTAPAYLYDKYLQKGNLDTEEATGVVYSVHGLHGYQSKANTISIWLYPKGRENAPEKIDVWYYQTYPEASPDSCYLVYYYHNEELVFKANNLTQFPILNVDFQ